MKYIQTILGMAAVLGLSSCANNGETFPRFQFTSNVIGQTPPAIRQPVVPEMLIACRGHVFVPALGMLLVPHGANPPSQGQYLREERLSAPYRILPPGARVSQEMSPTRLNVELDSVGRIIGLYCG